MASISGLVAKENVVGTFGVLFGLGDAGEADPGMWTAVGNMLPFAGARAAFLAFNLLCAPCFAAIGAIKREMASAKWTASPLVINVFWPIAWRDDQSVGLLFTGAGFTVGTAFAFLVLIVMLFLLFRPNPDRKNALKAARAAA